MSTICLAAQRSYVTGEAVWFAYRFPRARKVFSNLFLWALGLCAVLAAGLYAHLYWNLRHPAPDPINASAARPETQLSDMHYVYVSKPFPHPEPKAAPVKAALPDMADLPLNSGDADWQQAPDGNADIPHDTSRDTLPGTEEAPARLDDDALKNLLLQALKEQQQDYSNGKIPAPPIDETQDDSQRELHHQEIKRSPLSEKGDRLE